jgi:hypothetical protein
VTATATEDRVPVKAVECGSTRPLIGWHPTTRCRAGRNVGGDRNAATGDAPRQTEEIKKCKTQIR